MRWEDEAKTAMNLTGYKVIEKDGVTDWQGWGVLLGRNSKNFAVLGWSYGSCSGCDSYENMSEDEVVKDLQNNIEIFNTEEEARIKFDERKYW